MTHRKARGKFNESPREKAVNGTIFKHDPDAGRSRQEIEK